MADDPQKYTCAHCGYESSGKFVGDICPKCGLTYWKCGHRGFLITASKAPVTCPQCG
jgi:rubrerythrin